MRFNSVLPIAAAAVSIAMTTAVKPASAFTIGVEAISQDSSAQQQARKQIGESQFFADVIESGALPGLTSPPTVGTNQVGFIIRNTGSAPSSITNIYFDDAPPNTDPTPNANRILASISAIVNGSGVNFASGGTPTELPDNGRANPDFRATSGLSLASTGTSQTFIPNGINPSERLGVIFNLASGRTFSDVVTALSAGQLRIGLLADGFTGAGGNGSFSYVSNPNAVPEPFTIVGSGVALGVGAMMRKKQQKKEKSIG